MLKNIACFFIIILLSIFNLTCCFAKIDKSDKYKLAHIDLEEQLELKAEPQEMFFSFRAKKTSERFTLDLYYLNFKHLFAPTDRDDLLNIYQSLTGFSLEMYNKKSRKLIHSYKITENKKPSISTATSSLFLGTEIKIKEGQEYEIKLNLPAGKDIPDKYLKPVLVGGIVPKPCL